MRKLFQIASIAAFAAFLASSAGAVQPSQHDSEAMRYLSALHPDEQALLVIDIAGFEGTGILDLLQEELLKMPEIGDVLLETNSHIHELVQKAYLSLPDFGALDFEAGIEMPLMLLETDLPKNMIRDLFSGMGEEAPKRIEAENAVLWVFRDEDGDSALAELPNGLIGLGDLPTIQKMSRMAAGKEDEAAPTLVKYGPALQMYHDAQSPEAAAEGHALIWMGAAHLGKLYPPELAQSGFPYLPQTASMQFLRTPSGTYKATFGAYWEESLGAHVAKLNYTLTAHPENMLEFLSKMLPQGVYTAEGYIDYDPDMAELREGLEELRAFIERNPDMDEIAFEIDISLDEGGATVEAESSGEMMDEIVRSIKEEMQNSPESY